MRTEIDEACSKLWRLHSNSMQCQSGCSSCCQAFKILPVEYESIKENLKNLSFKINSEAKQGECKFLVDNKCQIYEHRPIICRTHGYPLVRLNEELEEYEVSYCPLNFKDYPLENFNSENVFFEDTFNSKLYQLNKDYLIDTSNDDYDAGQLLKLNSLAEDRK